MIRPVAPVLAAEASQPSILLLFGMPVASVPVGWIGNLAPPLDTPGGGRKVAHTGASGGTRGFRIRIRCVVHTVRTRGAVQGEGERL